jgi:hypothetical protein
MSLSALILVSLAKAISEQTLRFTYYYSPYRHLRSILILFPLKKREYFYMAGIWRPWTDRVQVNTLRVVVL